MGPCSPWKLLEAAFALTDAVFLCDHMEALACGHMSLWGASIGPSAVGRAGME